MENPQAALIVLINTKNDFLTWSMESVKKYVQSSGFEYARNGLYKTEYFRIKDNANMITLGVSYDINWGKSYKARNKRLNNSDNIDGIVK